MTTQKAQYYIAEVENEFAGMLMITLGGAIGEIVGFGGSTICFRFGEL